MNSKKKYPYAVMDENQASDMAESPESCHMSRIAAIDAAEKLNRKNPNAHYRAVQWDAARRARAYYECCFSA